MPLLSLPPCLQVYVRKRPFLDKFLAWVAARFEVVIFTASQQVRACVVDTDREKWGNYYALWRACVGCY